MSWLRDFLAFKYERRCIDGLRQVKVEVGFFWVLLCVSGLVWLGVR